MTDNQTKLIEAFDNACINATTTEEKKWLREKRGEYINLFGETGEQWEDEG